MTEVEQLLWAMIYRDSLKAGNDRLTATLHANDAVDDLRGTVSLYEQDS